MDNLNIVLCVRPADTREALGSGLQLCHLAYRFGGEGRLYRSGLGMSVRGGMLAVSDMGVTDATQFDGEVLYDIKSECDERGFTAVFCDFERGAGLYTTRFVIEAANFFKHAIKLYVPEAFANAAHGARIVVSSAVTGGTCDESYRRIVARYGAGRVALVYDPVCMDFIMPAPKGIDDYINSDELRAVIKRENAVSYFSRELCANYFTYRDSDGKSHFVMYDDERSMLRKLSVARSCGIDTVFIAFPDAYNCLDDLRTL